MVTKKTKASPAKKTRTTTKRVRATRVAKTTSPEQNQFVSMMVPVFTVLSIAFLVLVMVKYM